MKLKSLALAVSLIGLGTQAQAASYGSINVGDITPDLIMLGEFYANGLQPVPKDFFDYDFFFQSSLPVFMLGVAADLPSIGTRYNIAGMTASIWVDGGTVGIFGAGDVKLVDIGSGDTINGSGPLTAGSYFFRVSGEGVGTQGGQFSYSASAVPVPEPETWAMMLIGAGLVGFRLRTRSKKSALLRLC